MNGRLVRDKVLTHAIRFSYQGRMPGTSYPFTVLFIEIAPTEIDVNVHPAKVELRFNDSRKVHSAIYHAIDQALVLHDVSRNSLSTIAHNIGFTNRGEPEARGDFNSMPNSERDDTTRTFPAAEQSFPPRQAGIFTGNGQESESSFPGFPDEEAEETANQDISGSNEKSAATGPGDSVSRLRILGQFRESFIVAADSEGLMLVDQHVAHERILYEQALKAMESREGMASQALLFPESLSLNPEQKALADQFMASLNSNGYDIDWFGSDTIVVRAVPVLAKGADTRNLIDDLLQDSALFNETSDADSGERIRRLREKMATSLSCRAAIKVNTILSREKMEWLVDTLFQCRNPYTCPHGRPIVLKLGTDEILKGFKRL